MQTFLYTLHFLACFVLIGVVLLQRGKGADLGASLGGGGANTIFGSRGAGNFLSKITTGSAIVFMGTSLSLSYLGYQASDIQLFDESEPFEVPGAPAIPGADGGTLEEIPTAAEAAIDEQIDAGEGTLVEVPDLAPDDTQQGLEAAGDPTE